MNEFDPILTPSRPYPGDGVPNSRPYPGDGVPPVGGPTPDGVGGREVGGDPVPGDGVPYLGTCPSIHPLFVKMSNVTLARHQVTRENLGVTES
jgi:hypothetical protein